MSELASLMVLRAIDRLGPWARNAAIAADVGKSVVAIKNSALLLRQTGLLKVSASGKHRRLDITDRGRRCLAGQLAAPTPKDASGAAPVVRAVGRKKRLCLMCRQKFMSSGPAERVCRTCKKSREWQSSAAVQHVAQGTR